MESPKPHVAIFPGAGMGHLIPVAELTRHLSGTHGLSVTLITCKWMFSPRLMDPYTKNMASWGLDINFIELPEEEMEGAQHMKTGTYLAKLFEKSKAAMENVLRSLLHSASPVSAFITDLFCSTMFDVTAELRIPTYVFFTASASVLSVLLSLPKLVSEIPISFKDMDLPIEVPGTMPIPGRDMLTPLQDRSDEAFYRFYGHSSRLWEATGILINTFEELEPEAIKALVAGKICNPMDIDRMPCFYPVGPLMSSLPLEHNDKPVEDGGADCLEWLDKQPPSSVLFVSFGSGTGLPRAQVIEIALGLEASGHRFLWVLRSPSSSFLSIEEIEISQLLPEGFESRTQDRGLVVASWAPQIPVLSHPSTGGFLSHCGWNSTLESISHGVPMICWPLFAEQRMNRLLLVDEFKVGIPAKMESDDFVKRGEVERVVRELMEGEGGMRVRGRVKELKEAAVSALKEGGSLYKAMAAAVSEWAMNAATQEPQQPKHDFHSGRTTSR